ncbi:MAG: hypothetical protein IPI85_11015 [Dehalococcoidia bacterium]|nr:hypothetical protein [Dehalococcoidia bacterium]
MAGALLTAACDGGASESAANADVINAVNILETSGLHEMDEAVKKDGSISPDAKTTAERLQTIVLLTEWPKDLQPQARALAALFAEMARVVEGDDKAKAGDAIKKAHDGYHDFTHGVWEHLYDEAGLTSGTASHGH